MISGFRDDWLRDFFLYDSAAPRIPPALRSGVFCKLQLIDDATSDADLRVPPGNHFEKLRGRLEGLHSIRVNRRWRLVFEWNGSRGEVSGLYLDDHSYR